MSERTGRYQIPMEDIQSRFRKGVRFLIDLLRANLAIAIEDGRLHLSIEHPRNRHTETRDDDYGNDH